VPLKQLLAGPEEYVFVLPDVIESLLDVLDAVGRAAEIRVQGNAHDARLLGAFRIEPVEGVTHALEKNLGPLMLHGHQDNIVHLDRIGHRNDRAVRGADIAGQIVDCPIADVAYAGCGQVIDRSHGLGKAGAHPAFRTISGEAFDSFDRLLNRSRLIVDARQWHLYVVMPHELPFGIERGLSNAWIRLADASVNGERRADPAAVERLLETPEADAHAVFVPSPVADVGEHDEIGGSRNYYARHRALDVPIFNVDDRPHDYASPSGRALGPVDNS